MWAIDVIEGADLGSRFLLPTGTSRLGRGPDALSDPRVSRFHLEVRAGRGGVTWRYAPGVRPAATGLAGRTGRAGWRHWRPGEVVRLGQTALALRPLTVGSTVPDAAGGHGGAAGGTSDKTGQIGQPGGHDGPSLSGLTTSPLSAPLPAVGAGSRAGTSVPGGADTVRAAGWSLDDEREHALGGSGGQDSGLSGYGRYAGGGARGKAGLGTWVARLAMPVVFMLAWPLLRTGGWRRAALVIGAAVVAWALLRWVGAPLWRRLSARVREYRTRRLVRSDPARLLYSVLPRLAAQFPAPAAGSARTAPGVARQLSLSLDATGFAAGGAGSVGRIARPAGARPGGVRSGGARVGRAWARVGRAWARVGEGTVIGTVGEDGFALALWLSVQALCLGWRVEWVSARHSPAAGGSTAVTETQAGTFPAPGTVPAPGVGGPAGDSSRPARLYLAWAPTEAQLPHCRLLAPAGPLPGANWRSSAQRFWAARVLLPWPGRAESGWASTQRALTGRDRAQPGPAGPGQGELVPPAGTHPQRLPAWGTAPDPFSLCPLGRAELTFARSHPSLRAPIGVGQGGPVYLDLERDGPHALVAGRTGSGKSELLTFFLTGLALRNSPADLNLLLFDYKGGATFNPLRVLPHTVAVLTDLDGAAGERALQALQVELARRERLLTEFGRREVGQLPPGQRPAALVVAVDEFRVLRDSHPHLLATLLRLAAQGRSLGMHLVLATQRPAGAISPEIAANTSVRICLRVSTEVDSRDVLGHAGACLLPSPGGALVQTDAEVEIRTPALGTGRQSWREQSARACAELGGSPARPLWAPPLPAAIPVERVATAACPYPALVVDDVAAQAWTPIAAPVRSVLVAGGSGSGKSIACAQLAASAWAAGGRVCVLAHPGNPAWEPWWDLPGFAAVDGRDSRHIERVLAWWGSLAPGALEGAVLVIDDADQLDAPGSGVVDSLVRSFHSLGGACILACSQTRGLARLAPGRLLLAGAPAELMPRAAQGGPGPATPGAAPPPAPSAPGRGLWLAEAWVACQVTLPSGAAAGIARGQAAEREAARERIAQPVRPGVPSAAAAAVQRDQVAMSVDLGAPGVLHQRAAAWTAQNPALPGPCRLAQLPPPAPPAPPVGAAPGAARALPGVAGAPTPTTLPTPADQGGWRGPGSTGGPSGTGGPRGRGGPGGQLDWLGVGMSPAGPVWVPSNVAVIGAPGALRDQVEAGLRMQLRPATSPAAGEPAGGEADCPVVAASPEEALGALRGPLAEAKARGALVFVGQLSRAARALAPVDLGQSSLHPDGAIVVYRSVQEVRLCQELSGVGVEHRPQHAQG
ncbi:FtsK/SpoIIIE domain-containing protein [Buchananella felis]|uniref:FtsK/SpoIIIE domain-containing protein n=1 Tax=Buchananella felis TaxID=3231492 RepID=UPI0035296C1D